MWQGGAGLATNSFSVNAGGSTNPPPTTTTATAPPTTTGSSGGPSCSATYSVVNSWSGGFQASVQVANTGTTPTTGWAVNWTFPGDQKINNLWNAGFTQSGSQVQATNASFDGALAPGAATTMGFTATSTSNTSPTAVSCTAH
jgi:cellulose 1,4-beta-cellobiosidase